MTRTEKHGKSSHKTLLSLESVGVVRDRRHLIQEIGLSVAAGEIVTVIGPNGAGKTTLVKTALGLIKPDEGRVIRAPGLTIGYVPQRLTLSPTLPLTAGRFLSLWRTPDGRKVTRETVAAALERAGIPGRADSQIHSLSGGETQRLLLARALLGKPDLLVLDEPDQALDLQGQAEFFSRIDQVRERDGCGVLLVSHDLHTVMARTDRVYCINGHVCCSGTPEAVGRHPEFAALFGREALQVAVYVHHHDHEHGTDGRVLPAVLPPCPHGDSACSVLAESLAAAPPVKRGHKHDHGHGHGCGHHHKHDHESPAERV